MFALLLVTACKKQPPAGDLPPAGDPQAKPAPAAPANPHADSTPPANPHGDSAAPSSPTMPMKTEPKTLEKLADGRLVLGPFSLALPPKWTVKPVTSNMRAADFVLPGDGELIVYYFGEGGAGSVDDNLDRWLGQFQQPDGKKSRDVAKIEKLKFGGQDATFVSVTGRYVAAAMPGMSGGDVDKADQRLLAAIVASPSGPYYFKLTGSRATLEANDAAFRAMLNSLKLR